MGIASTPPGLQPKTMELTKIGRWWIGEREQAAVDWERGGVSNLVGRFGLGKSQEEDREGR